ncbi:MAG: rhodanese-like domain-containing protein [Pseudomonadota bacterium]
MSTSEIAVRQGRGGLSRRAFGAAGLALLPLTLLVPRTAAAASDAAPASVTMLAPADLAARLKSKDFFLVNVHVPYDGEIDGTDAFVPFDQVDANLDRFPKDRSAPVVVYCRSGRMSAIAARRLAELGFSKVSDLSGGMNAWTEAGFSLIRR